MELTFITSVHEREELAADPEVLGLVVVDDALGRR